MTSPSSARFTHPQLYLTVFITGASVMVIELLGTRLIAPFYGSSLYVWSSLISVTMIALSIGYFLGGRWADGRRDIGLSVIIALAGLLTLLIPWATRPILLATDPLGLRAGAFVSALALFSPSLILLGMVGPFAIQRATVQLDRIGNSAGSIYAISTLGSVLGTLILGFFLFPRVGSREILMGNGFALLVLALWIALRERKALGPARSVLPCLVLAALGVSALPGVMEAGAGQGGGKTYLTLSEQESLYGWVRVIDQKSRDLRLLSADGSVIGAGSIRSGKSRLSYQDIVAVIPALRPHMQRALIIGLGAGHMSKVLEDRYGLVADVLEIDPAVATAATRYFGFKPSGRLIVGDARYEIRHLQGPYDLIIHDCFTGGSEPAYLLTVETLEQLRGLLAESGILAVNFVTFAHGPNSTALASVARTIDQVLPERAVFISEPGKDFTDFIFLASRQPLDLHAATLQDEQQRWLQERWFAVDAQSGPLLTDNFNPLEHLQIAKAEQYRHFMVEMFGPGLFVR